MNRPKTISKEYLAAQKELHRDPYYGKAAEVYAPLVADIFRKTGARSISDYGAGKKSLLGALFGLGIRDFSYHPYDPAFPEYGKPEPADLVCCIDVLEHIELPFIEAVLHDLRSITPKVGFFSIATRPARKVLPDGRNAHLIQKPSSWWLPKLCANFEIYQLATESGHGFWVIAEPRKVK